MLTLIEEVGLVTQLDGVIITALNRTGAVTAPQGVDVRRPQEGALAAQGHVPPAAGQLRPTSAAGLPRRSLPSG